MQDKSTITYWLRQPGEDSGEAIDILKTITTKVPEVGEVVNINTNIESGWLKSRFSHLSEKQLKAFIRSEESQLKGDFVVVDVKRWLKTRHVPISADEVFEIDTTKSSNPSRKSTELPAEVTTEDFEVFVEPFRHTELTETPIAKVRNSLGSIFGMIDMLSLIGEHPDKEKELLELFKDSIKDTKESMARLRELIGNDKNWR
jgi:hypothetical protein